MRRRVVLGHLAGLGATTGLAGCLSLPGNDDGSDDTAGAGERSSAADVDDVATDENNSTATRPAVDTVTVGAYEAEFVTNAGTLGFTVDVDDPEFGSEQPARITVEVTNESADTVTIETGHRGAFSAMHDRDETTFLLSVGRDVEDDAADVECPMLIDRPETQDETIALELTAGESHHDSLALWVDFDGLDGRCPEPGTVRFQNTVLVEGDGTSDADRVDSNFNSNDISPGSGPETAGWRSDRYFWLA